MEIVLVSIMSFVLLLGMLIWFFISMYAKEVDPAFWTLVHSLQLTRSLTLIDVHYPPIFKLFLNKGLAVLQFTYVIPVENSDLERYVSFGFHSL